MPADVSIIVIGLNEEKMLEKLIKTNEEIIFYLEKNSTAGQWKINAKAQGKESEKIFFVLENQEATFEINENILKITNVGNVPYTRSVEIKIGDETEIREVNLELGETISYELEAPDGEYEISINDGTTLATGKSYLTGMAISVNEITEKISLLMKYPIVWIFLILVVGMFIFVSARKVMKKTYTIRKPHFKEEERGFVKIKPAASAHVPGREPEVFKKPGFD